MAERHDEYDLAPQRPITRDKSQMSQPATGRASQYSARGSQVYQKEPSLWSQHMSSFSLKAYMNERTVSTMAWTCFAMLLAAFLCTIVVFAAPGWSKTFEIRGIVGQFEGEMYGQYGLWYACWELRDDPRSTHTDCELYANLRDIPNWFRGCQALAIIGLLTGVAMLAILSVYIFSTKFNKNAIIIRSTMLLSFFTGLCTAVLFVVFCILFLHDAKWCCTGAVQIINWRLDYCFALSCLTTALYWSAGVTAFLELRSLGQGQRKDKYLQRVASTRKEHPPRNAYY